VCESTDSGAEMNGLILLVNELCSEFISENIPTSRTNPLTSVN
jgi:hypothetical protein